MTPLDSSEVMQQVVASPTIFILMTLAVSFALLVNIYSNGINMTNVIYNCHCYILQAIGDKWLLGSYPYISSSVVECSNNCAIAACPVQNDFTKIFKSVSHKHNTSFST